MEVLFNFLLGVIQGLTEFLPVSSSGHLEIAKSLFQLHNSGSESMLMTVVLHFATAISTLIVFRNDIKTLFRGLFSKEDSTQRFFSYKIILSMLPAVAVGLLFDDILDELFSGELILVACMLIITGLLLFLADKSKPTLKNVSFKNSFLIGIAQAVAILPGISRSGATIATSVLLGVDKESAARFSFLMVIPLIFGKMVKDILAGSFLVGDVDLLSLFMGFLGALITGIFACNLMIRLVKNSQLKYFSIYCFIIAFFTLIVVLQ